MCFSFLNENMVKRVKNNPEDFSVYIFFYDFCQIMQKRGVKFFLYL